MRTGQVFCGGESSGVLGSNPSLPCRLWGGALGMSRSLWETQILHLNPEKNQTRGCKNSKNCVKRLAQEHGEGGNIMLVIFNKCNL